MTRRALESPRLIAALPAPPAMGLAPRLVVADLIVASFGWIGLLLVQPAAQTGAVTVPLVRVAWAAGAVMMTLVLIAGHGLYRPRASGARTTVLPGLRRSAMGIAVGLVAIEHVVGGPIQPRELLVATGVTFVGLAVERALFGEWLRRQRAEGRFVRNLILVGADADTVELAGVMREHPELGLRVCGYVGSSARGPALRAPHLGDISDALAALRATAAQDALVSASAMEPDLLNHTVRLLLRNGIHVQLSSGLRGIAQQRLRATPLSHEPLFSVEPRSLRSWQVVCKRTIDVVGALVGLVITMPVLALAAIAIKVDSRGPVLFRQQRVGRGGQLFTFFKLRTMIADAEAQQRHVRANNQRTSGPLFKLADDPRITRVGRILRATSVDELPQLWNVLTGSMSLVGPRPALPAEVVHFDDDLRSRTRVAPGMTGLWQVEARDNPAFGPYRRLDLFYVENWSPLFDCWIVAATIVRVTVRGARLLSSFGRRGNPTIIALD